MADTENKALKAIKKISKEEDIQRVQNIVSQHLPELTASALSAAVGATVLLKVSVSEQGKIKYIPVHETEEIVQGLEWIATYGNSMQEEGFFILQQKPPDAKFWDMLTQRHLGKVPDEQRVSMEHKLDLASIGKMAVQKNNNNSGKERNEQELYIPSSWLI